MSLSASIAVIVTALGLAGRAVVRNSLLVRAVQRNAVPGVPDSYVRDGVGVNATLEANAAIKSIVRRYGDDI